MGEYSLKEVLEFTINILDNIQIPAGYIRQIGEPVADASENLKMCVKAMQEEKKDTEDDTEVVENDDECS